MNMIKTFLIIATLSVISNFGYSQINGPEMSGMLKLEEVKIYWDKAETQLRSVGYYRTNGTSSVGEKFGKWKFYYRDGKLEEKCNYYDGRLNGEVKQYYPNGNKKFKGYFYLGVPDSLFKVYHLNGELAEEGLFYSIPDSIRESPLSYWSIIEYIEPKKVGTWKSYYESGKPWKELHHKPGDTLEYLMKFFDREGTMQVSGGNGLIKEFSTLGKPRMELGYKNGLRDGVYKQWNANNTLREEGAYKDNLQTGEWNLYTFKSGKLYQKVNYIEGKRDGPFVEYMPNDT
jgi:antitoxin component YwqK of YwqJK toxin-antitoxin module